MGSAKNRLVIGLVGQVCAGKSAVSQAFKRRGAMIYDADKHVHELYAQPEVIGQVRALFGPGVIDPKGGVDRKALGNLVFSDPEKLKVLTEQVVYPRTDAAMKQALADYSSSTAPALVLDAPTLFEAGRESLCDRIVFVSAPLERRRQWARARGWQPEELERREARLHDENLKRSRADAVIENDSTLEQLDQQAAVLLEKWLGGAPTHRG